MEETQIKEKSALVIPAVLIGTFLVLSLYDIFVGSYIHDAVYELGKDIFQSKENMTPERIAELKTDEFACFVGKKVIQKIL